MVLRLIQSSVGSSKHVDIESVTEERANGASRCIEAGPINHRVVATPRAERRLVQVDHDRSMFVDRKAEPPGNRLDVAERRPSVRENKNALSVPFDIETGGLGCLATDEGDPRPLPGVAYRLEGESIVHLRVADIEDPSNRCARRLQLSCQAKEPRDGNTVGRLALPRRAICIEPDLGCNPHEPRKSIVGWGKAAIDDEVAEDIVYRPFAVDLHVTYPLSTSASALRTEPRAAPRIVLCTTTTMRRSKRGQRRTRPTLTVIPRPVLRSIRG